MSDEEERVAADLHQLLNPYDERDIPVPGFPSCDAVAAWAATRPRDAIVRALLDVLESGGVPQQSAAVAVLRSLGVTVDAERVGSEIRWRTSEHN